MRIISVFLLVLLCSFAVAAPVKRHKHAKTAQDLDLTPIPLIKMEKVPSQTLLDSVGDGDAPGVEAALKRGAKIDQVDDHYETPLMIAVTGPSLKVVKVLLAHHASVNMEDLGGLTALDLATLPDSIHLPDPGNERSQTIALLKAAGAEPGDHHKAIFSSDKRLFARVTTFREDPIASGVHVLEGDVTNHSRASISYVEIDANFGDVDTVADSGMSNVQNLAAGGTWHFKVRTSADNVFGYELTKLVAH